MRKTSPISRLRKVWHAMLKRCTRPTDPSFRNYGGRGITVCSEWMTFDSFLADMGIPEPGLTLERMDVNGPYAPSNCRWATRKEQGRNTRVNRVITHQGESLCLAEWAERLSLSESFIRRRMAVQGMTFGEAITQPKRYAIWRKARMEATRGLA